MQQDTGSLCYRQYQVVNTPCMNAIVCFRNISTHRSLTTGRGGGGRQNGKIAGPKPVIPPTSQQVKTFQAPPPPPFKRWKLFAPPPKVWLELQALILKLPQNFLCSHFSMAKTFAAPSFCRGKTTLTLLPLPFCSPAPYP